MVNIDLMKQWQNWVIILFMVFLPFAAWKVVRHFNSAKSA